MYNLPIIIAEHMYKKVLSVNNTQHIQHHIMLYTQKLTKDNQNEIKQTLFNLSLTPARLYPPFVRNSVNRGIRYNQYDLYYLMLSNIATLQSGNISTTSQDFIQLHNYLKPSFDKMMNTTKMNFHLQLEQ